MASADFDKVPQNKLPTGFQVAANTLSKVVKTNPVDKIDVEIGDSKQPDFKPQFKVSRWDNEVNFSLRAEEHPGASVVTESGKIKYKTPDYEVHMYEKPDVSEDGGFEFEWELPKKPKSNVLTTTIQTKELDFFYQPALTQEEIDEGAERPENVVGSYAVYHKTKKNNKVGGKEYKTGKAFHIYRPKAIDANNTEVWCDLNIDEQVGTLSVTVPQDFLDNAVYPVLVDPTLGYTTGGGTNLLLADNNSDTSRMVGISSILSESGTLDSLHAYLLANTSTETLDLYMGLYTMDDPSVSTHARVTGVERTSVSVTTTPTWYTFTASSESLAADTYIVSVLGDGEDIPTTGHIVYATYDSVTGGWYSESTTGAGSYTTRKNEDPWTEIASGGIQFSVYATYTAFGTEYTLTAASCSLTLTERTANLPVARSLNASTKSLSLTGNAASFTVDRTLTASTKALSFTGNDAILTAIQGYVLTAEAGSLTVSTHQATLAVNRVLTADTGSLTNTTNTATFSINRALSCATKSLNVATGTTNLTKDLNLVASTSSISLTGNDAALTRSYYFNAEAGTLTLTGNDASLVKDVVLVAATKSLTFSGKNASLYTVAPVSQIFINLDTNNVMYKLTDTYFINL